MLPAVATPPSPTSARLSTNGGTTARPSSPNRHLSTEAEHQLQPRRVMMTVVRFDLDQIRTGLDVELEHGRWDPATNVITDDPVVTGKVALARLKGEPD